MRLDDVPVAERLSARAFLSVDLVDHRAGTPAPQPRSVSRGERWMARTASFLDTDAGGCWVAEDDAGMAGFATAVTRELMWLLSTYAVRPDAQGAGIGRQLLDAALHHGRGCLRGMLASSSDPRAFRRYRHAGFTLHPQLVAEGEVVRSEIPVIEKVREAGLSDRDLMDSVDRQTRGAAHGGDHRLLALQGRPLVCDAATGSGYVYVDPTGSAVALAATNRRTATELLWAALAESSGPVRLAHITAANQWAVDVALAARLSIRTEGYLGVRAMNPPAPYLHNGGLL